MSQHVFTIRTNLIIFAILMALLVLTVLAAVAVDLGPLEIPVAMTIALVKAVLIMLFFMHLKFSSRLTWLFAGSGTLWLVILIAFTLSDFLSRGWISPIVTEPAPRQAAINYFGGVPDPGMEIYQSTFETTGETIGGNPPDRTAPPAH